jgi:hypothetical protein
VSSEASGNGVSTPSAVGKADPSANINAKRQTAFNSIRVWISINNLKLIIVSRQLKKYIGNNFRAI